MKENTNRYYNRVSGEVTDNKLLNTNIFDRQAGFISLSMKETIFSGETPKEYKLKISNIKLGTDNQFGSKITNYVCKYTVADTTDDCICPEGTKYAGVKVSEIIDECSKEITNVDYNYNNTCSELQEKICNYEISKDITGEDIVIYCRGGEAENEYCTNVTTNEEVSIKECLENGNSRYNCEVKAGCIRNVCPEGNCCTGNCKWNYKKIGSVTYGIYTCNNNGTSKNCDFTVYCNKENICTSQSADTCVKTQLGIDIVTGTLYGISTAKLEYAIKACENTICGSTEKIIFRTIDLQNPFPGNANNRTKTGFSLTDSRSRTPGENWNGTTTANDNILNARGVKGYAIYSKEPLITITLTPSDIKKIRNYNATHSYDNFNLKCVNDASSANCISYFIHSSETELGTSLKISGLGNCTKLSASSTVEDFNNCYNSNN